MNFDEGAYSGAIPAIAVPQPDTNAIIRGLERKLDVLRAQLEACRSGKDIGEAGVTTWSRLEAQSQRICQLEQELELAREEIQIGQRANIALGRALDGAPLTDVPMLEAMRNSTSWRITAPMRVAVIKWKRLRDIIGF